MALLLQEDHAFLLHVIGSEIVCTDGALLPSFNNCVRIFGTGREESNIKILTIRFSIRKFVTSDRPDQNIYF